MCEKSVVNGQSDRVILAPITLKENKNKYTKFCLTFNNYTEEDYEDVLMWSKGQTIKYIIGREVGDEGTPHLQIYFQTIKRMRFSEFKNIKCLMKCHVENAKGSEEDNVNYCSKEKNYVCSNNINVEEELIIKNDLFKWQIDLEKILLMCKSDRFIYWIYEDIGGVGKSCFIKYMINKYNCLLCGGGKKSDVINIIFNNKSYMKRTGTKIVLFDIPRCNKGGISYSALEEIKNGIIINTKFETGSFICNSPVVCVFSNVMPDVDKFSIDRWKIYNIKNNKLLKVDPRNCIIKIVSDLDLES